MSKTVIILIALGSVVAYVGVWLWIFTEQKRAIDEVNRDQYPDAPRP